MCLYGSKNAVFAAESIKTKWAWDGGIKINVPAFFDFSLGAYCNEDFSFSYGLQASFGKGRLPVEVKAGKLAFGGSSSLLNTAVLSSSVSPFAQGTGSIKKLTATLPSDASSSSRPLGGLVQVNGSQKKLYGNVFGNMEGNYGFSLGSSTKNPLGRLELGITGLFSDYKALSERTDSWFSRDECFYRKGTMFSTALQGALSGNGYGLVLYSMLFLNPFNEITPVFRGEINGKLFDNAFTISGFYNPCHNVMTGSGRHYDELIQLKGNINRSLRTGLKTPLFWKWGTAVFYEGNLTEKTDAFKLSLGLRLTGLSFYINTVLQGDFLLHLPENPFPFYGSVSRFSVNLRNGYYFKALTPVFRLSFQGEPDASDHSLLLTENMGVNINLPVNPSVSMDFSGSFSQEDGKSKGGNAKVSVQVKLKTRYITLTGKGSLSIEF